MDDCTDAHTHQNVGEYLFKGSDHLFFGIGQSVFAGQGGGLDVHADCFEDEFLHMAFHVQCLDQAAARHCNDQPNDHIGHGDLRTENAGKQNQAAQVNHRGGDQKGEGDAQRQASAGEPHEQGDGGTGAEGGNSAQKSGDTVGPKTVEAADDLFAALRGKIALDVGNEEDQGAQQDGDLDHVVQKELQAAAQPGRDVQTEGAEQGANGAVQPFHAQNLILKKGPYHWQQPSMVSEFRPSSARKA